MKVVYQPAAEAELLEAARFYGSRAEGQGIAFLAAIDRSIHEIASAPQRYRIVGQNIRRCVIGGYPFIVFFRDYPDHIRVLAVAHTSRHPAYWKQRLKKG